MSPEDAKGIIELGNKNIKCLIFSINQNNDSEIISTAVAPSEGIRNDVVENLSKASNAIRTCISNAEKKAKISLKRINVVFEQPDFLCTKFSKQKKIDGSKIHKDDIEFLLKEAKKQLILNDDKQSIIHIFNYNYIVDGKKFLEEPIGVYADLLTHEVSFITTLKNNLRNLNQIFIECDIEIERLISKTFATGVELLSNEEMESGSILIDIGFQKISLGLFKNLALVHSTTFPFGTNYIAKDISKVCSLTFNESKKIIRDIDYLFTDQQKAFDEEGYLKNIYFFESNFRKISKKLILNIIKARLDEIINITKKNLTFPGHNLDLVTKILLIGNGINYFNIKKYIFNFLGKNVTEINSREIIDKNLSSCLGAVKIVKDGWETEAIPNISDRNIEKMGFFAKIFGINK